MSKTDAVLHIGDTPLWKRRIKFNGVVQDISTATTKEFVFVAPSGAIKNVAAVFTTDGTDGYIQANIPTDHFDEEGWWEFCSHITLSGGQNWHSRYRRRRVYPVT